MTYFVVSIGQSLFKVWLMDIMIILIVYFNQSKAIQLILCGAVGMCGKTVSERSQVRVPTVDFTQNLFDK